MTKVRVQDATKELSTNTGRMLESISQMRKKTQDMLGNLRKISGDFAREAQEIREREAREEQKKRYEAEAQFMNAYSSEQVPEVPAETRAEAAPQKAPEPEKKAEEVKAEKVEAKKEEPAPAAPARPWPTPSARSSAHTPATRPLPASPTSSANTPWIGTAY